MVENLKIIKNSLNGIIDCIFIMILLYIISSAIPYMISINLLTNSTVPSIANIINVAQIIVWGCIEIILINLVDKL